MQQMIQLTLSLDDCQVIVDGLGLMPLGKAIGTFARVQDQVAAQRQPMAQPVAEPNGTGQKPDEGKPETIN